MSNAIHGRCDINHDSNSNDQLSFINIIINNVNTSAIKITATMTSFQIRCNHEKQKNNDGNVKATIPLGQKARTDTKKHHQVTRIRH
mmetsp:Transcript_2627/g.4702  ORF Transcript_2627/g.4702 Transcript_2627/m.4702 type:complete len:87 (+) Transcript_2627:232-492(+)